MAHEPVYRPVLKEALNMSWRSPRLWPLALGAGILLTGSVYDVAWRMMNALAPQASLSAFLGVFWSRATNSWSQFSLGETIFGGVQVFQITALFTILGFAIAGLSVICQGALVFAVGNNRIGKQPTMRELLAVGARSFWPVLVLNIMSLAVLLATRALFAISLSVAADSGKAGPYFLSILAFITFTVIAAAAAIIQIFALNAMILQGATLAQALVRGARILERHWVVAVETAVILFVAALVSSAAVLIANIALGLPLFFLLLAVTALGPPFLLTMMFVTSIVLFGLVLLAVGGWLIVFQYSSWTLLYRRVGEGGALPKLHRWVRSITHDTHIPGA